MEFGSPHLHRKRPQHWEDTNPFARPCDPLLLLLTTLFEKSQRRPESLNMLCSGYRLVSPEVQDRDLPGSCDNRHRENKDIGMNTLSQHTFRTTNPVLAARSLWILSEIRPANAARRRDLASSSGDLRARPRPEEQRTGRREPPARPSYVLPSFVPSSRVEVFV